MRNFILVPCGNQWMDCEYYDPDTCDLGECILEDTVLWDYEYGDGDTEYNYVYANMVAGINS